MQPITYLLTSIFIEMDLFLCDINHFSKKQNIKFCIENFQSQGMKKIKMKFFLNFHLPSKSIIRKKFKLQICHFAK